jgi:hypothetical protein
MNYIKNIGLILLISFAFIRCTEIYIPTINSDEKALIVEGLITDEAGPFTIKLSEAMASSFNSSVASTAVSGAKLAITDNENHTFELTELTAGSYVTPSNFTTKVGDSYKLNITTLDGNEYESKVEKLSEPQTYDSIRAIHGTEDYVDGNNELQSVPGADILVNLFKFQSNSDSVPSCRFQSNIIIQYVYTVQGTDSLGNVDMNWHWVFFGWDTFKLNSIENITDEKKVTSNPQIQNHSIGFMPFRASSYGLVLPSLTTISYYLRVSQYTMNNDSYRFYKGANNQLSASGKIFDPITSQLHGNMKCVSNPAKIVLGLFEVSSVKQNAFLVTGSYLSDIISVTKAVVVDVPKSSGKRYKQWGGMGPMPQNDPLFIPIPFPNWWYHN